MSMFGNAFSAVRRLMLMDSELARINTAIDRADQRLDDHNSRLVRIETLIEFGGPARPRRLPGA